MKRMAWIAASAAACTLWFAPGASAYLTSDSFDTVSATSATFGSPANSLTLDARLDHGSTVPTGSLTLSGTDAKGTHSIDADVVCMSVQIDQASVLAHVTSATGESAGLTGVMLRLTDTEQPDSEVGEGDKIAVTRFNSRQYQRQQAAGCASAPGKASLTAGNITITAGISLPPCFPFCGGPL
jgi:hypothetical protein